MKLTPPLTLAVALFTGMAAGCVNKQRMTEPARSVGEQLLISTAIDRALSELDMEAIRRLKGSRYIYRRNTSKRSIRNI